jgi:uncharacterized protein (UPF0335 family)
MTEDIATTGVAAEELRQFIDRILRLKEDQDALSEDIRDIYAEAKARGYDKTAMGRVVTLLRARAKDAEKVSEQEAIVALYLDTYEAASSRTHARARAA